MERILGCLEEGRKETISSITKIINIGLTITDIIKANNSNKKQISMLVEKNRQ